MGKFSFRNFKIGEQFTKEFKACSKKKKKDLCERKVRVKYRNVENGRLAEMGEKIHKFVFPLDPDEKEIFKKKFPDTTRIVNEYAVVEEQLET